METWRRAGVITSLMAWCVQLLFSLATIEHLTEDDQVSWCPCLYVDAGGENDDEAAAAAAGGGDDEAEDGHADAADPLPVSYSKPVFS